MDKNEKVEYCQHLLELAKNRLAAVPAHESRVRKHEQEQVEALEYRLELLKNEEG